MKKTTMLKKNYEFRAVLTKGKIFKKEVIEAFITKNNKKRNFLGIAISTKNGKAFQRNRAKRIIRECYNRLENRTTEGNSIVVLIRKDFDLNNLNFNSVLKSMEICFDEAKILKKGEKI